jgi:hypothetical protein
MNTDAALTTPAHGGGSMADLDVSKKLRIYHILYRLNLSFAAIVDHCRTLEATRFFPSKSLRNFQGFTRELQAEINEELLDTLHQAELDDWNRFGKVREAWEKSIRDPDDVFIQAEERRKELAKRKKKAK